MSVQLEVFMLILKLLRDKTDDQLFLWWWWQSRSFIPLHCLAQGLRWCICVGLGGGIV